MIFLLNILIILIKLRKVECKFCGNVISYYKDKMFFHLGYRYDGNGQTRIAMCSKTHPWAKALFVWCGGLLPPPLNDMEVPTHISDGRTKSKAMETLNPSMKEEFVLTSQVEGAQNFTPLNNTKGPNISTNNNIWTFW